MQQSYNTFKKEFEDHVSLLSREREEREKYVLRDKKTWTGKTNLTWLIFKIDIGGNRFIDLFSWDH